MKKRYIFLWIAIIILILSGSRMLWMNAFSNDPHKEIKSGQLDLHDWDAQEQEVLLLDGEWEFYPSQLLMDGHWQSGLDRKKKEVIQVPGEWNEDLQSGQSTPYGYGSYRLLLHVDPEEKINYSIYVPSVRSSSELYVNGRYLDGSGHVGKSKDEYSAKNLPYSATFTADENGVIDIVIQASNFKDSRKSGIIRSIKFGTEEAISKERNLSLLMQGLASVIFLIHSLYAVILFFLGKREKKILYFSLLLFCLTLMNLLSFDEKLFHLLFDIGYEWDFRLANLIVPIGSYALLQCLDHRNLPYWRVINPVFTIVSIGLGVTLFLSTDQIIMLFPVYYFVAGFAIIIGIITVIQKVYNDITGNILLLFSLIVIIHHFVWLLYWKEIGISVVHYPLDMIISIGFFASIWFKNYFTMYVETENLAARLQKMNEHKEQFLANTSHEFKNPLHGIINMSQAILIRERHSLKSKSINELETVLSVGQRMSLLLNDLLDVSSIREGNPRIKKEVFSIQSILTGVIDMLQFSLEGKPVKIMNQIPEDFPPVYADRNRMIQVIYNLLHNAVKYTDEGKIQIEGKVKAKRAFIKITDTGIGMDKEFLQNLFQPYEQSFDGSMIESGFGLGLSISKQLVELHDGQLEATSTLGEGSEFTFSLQLASIGESDTVENVPWIKEQKKILAGMSDDRLAEASIDLAERETAVATEQTTDTATDPGRIPILVVDDDPVNLKVIQSILSIDQYDVTTVFNGKEAIAKVEKQEWDLVISDIMMPQMSGYELTKIIRRRYSLTELPILLLTARSDPKDIHAGFLAGANDYVTKPVEMLELRSRVKALTTVKKAVREQLQLEAAWLQAQIQPHFLFNTLNSIMALSEIDLNKMNDLLMELSTYLRGKFQFHYINELIPLEEELHIVQAYVNIEQVRFGDRLKVVWNIDEYENVKIPFLTIQPLVENAIRHGIMKRVSGGNLVISVSIHEKYTEISVEDDGVGMDEAQLQHLLKRTKGNKTSIGLMNTNQRLIRNFGRGLTIKSTVDQGTKVSFRVTI